MTPPCLVVRVAARALLDAIYPASQMGGLTHIKYCRVPGAGGRGLAAIASVGCGAGPPRARDWMAKPVKIARMSLAAILLQLLPAVAMAATASGSSLADMPRARIEVDGRVYAVRLAATAEHRGAGFQHVAPGDMTDEAIYFAYERPARPTYHMHNVARPLQLAWIRPDGRVLGVIRMEPGSGGHRPDEPVSAVLEYTADHPLADRVGPGSTIVLRRP